ncbi:MAG TPA: hypothetical protein VH394_00805 [Thermoanaerobaculia bacterium]|jgi:sporulation protein YlmC with PRC-barrel domain|nr:hypothetical protein [Thermoanaerobaculia bacterium]
MSTPKIRFQELLGKMVRDPKGVGVGRIFSAHAEIEDDGAVIREFLLGPGALLERFGISVRRWEPMRVPWDLLDIADPQHPRLRCSAAELAGRRS